MSKLSELSTLLDDDVFTDAPEYRERVGRIVKLSDEVVVANLTDEDIKFLTWALGFVEGRVEDMKHMEITRRVEIVQRCREIWPKLSALL